MIGENSISLSKVTHEGNADQLACRVFHDSGDGRIDLFKAINFPENGAARTGQTLIIPHTKDMLKDAMTELQSAATRTNQGQPIISQRQTGLHKTSWNLFDIASRYDMSRFEPNSLETVTGMAEAYTAGVEGSLLEIRKGLQGLDKLYSRVPVGVGKGTARSVLMSKEFITERKVLETNIKSALSKINRNLVLERDAGDNLRNTLKLGKSSVSVKAARGKDFMHKLAKTDARVSKSLSGTKLIGKGFIALNLATIAHDTVESYKQDGLSASSKTLASRSAGTAAGMKTAAVVTGIVFGAGTGGLGYVALGVVAIAASSFAASKATEGLVEGMIDVTNDQIDRLIWEGS